MIELEHDSDINVIFTQEKKTDNHEIFIDAEYCFPKIEVGDRILLDDGLIQLTVKSINQKNMALKCQVEKGGYLEVIKDLRLRIRSYIVQGLGKIRKI